MRIGHSAIPRMRVPALLKGKVTYFDLASIRGRWSMICCLPPFDFGEAVFLNQYHRAVEKEGTMLLGMFAILCSRSRPMPPKSEGSPDSFTSGPSTTTTTHVRFSWETYYESLPEFRC